MDPKLTDEQQARVVEATIAGTPCYETILLELLRQSRLEGLIATSYPQVIFNEFANTAHLAGAIYRVRYPWIELVNASNVEVMNSMYVPRNHQTFDLIWAPDGQLFGADLEYYRYMLANRRGKLLEGHLRIQPEAHRYRPWL